MNQEKIVHSVQQLAAMPTVATNVPALHEATQFIAALLSEHPEITIERFESNGKPSLLAYVGKVRPLKFDVLFHAHLDVVPAGASQFVPRLENGRLYGRGVHDMKTAAVVMTDVFRRMAGAVPYSLGFQVVTDEEVGGYDGAFYQLQTHGVRADFIITGEHNFQDNVLYNASRGICWLEVAFKGKTAHGGYVWKGENAIMKASDFVQEVLRRYPNPDEEIWGTTANVAGIHTTNEAFNRIPDNAIVKIDFRFTKEDPVFQSRESVSAFVRSIDPTAEIFAFHTMEQAVHVPEDHPYLQCLAQAVQGALHKDIVFQSRPAGSDGRHHATVGGNVIEYGMNGTDPHGDEEYIEVASIASYQQSLESFLRTLPYTSVRDIARAAQVRSAVRRTPRPV